MVKYISADQDERQRCFDFGASPIKNNFLPIIDR
jgi:hypothetical protein